MANYTTELDVLKAVASADGNTDALNVTATVGSSALPAGAATSSKQDTGNTSIASVDTKTPALGQALMAASSPVVIASNQSSIPVTGAFYQATQPVSLPTSIVSGTFVTSGSPQSATIDCTGQGSVLLQITGTWSATIAFLGGVNGSYVIAPVGIDLVAGLGTDLVPGLTTTTGVWQFGCAGFTSFKITAASVASGTVTYVMSTSVAPSMLTSIAGTIFAGQAGTWNVNSTNAEVIAQASTTSGQSGSLSMAATTTAVPTYTNLKSNPLNTNTSGGLRCDMAQINGVTPLMGAGSTGTGSPRVTIATDQAILTNAWKSNVAQINSVAPLMGNGVTGTGSQRVTLASDGTVNTNTFSTRSDTFTTATNGVTVDISAKPMSKFSVQVVATGAVTSWNVVLEGSLNNSNFTTLATVDSVADGTGTVKFGATSTPCLYFRSRCTAIVVGSGTNVVTTILGLT